MKRVSLVLILVCWLSLLTGCGSASGNGITQSAVTHFSVTGAGNAVAGTAFNITVTALDASNNTVTTYAGTVHFTSSDTKALLPAASALTNGKGSFSVTLMTSGDQTITVMDTITASITGTSNSITVRDSATHFSFTVPSNSTGGISFNMTLSALDATNNVVTGYGGTVKFTSTDTQAVLPANTTLTNGTGTFPVTLNTLGSQTITAMDTTTASITGSSSAITVGTNAATHLGVNFFPLGWSPGNPLSFTVNALDRANNTALSYSGTIYFTSTDPMASLPANSSLANGTANFSASLNTVGQQTITATDTGNASITGTSRSINIAKLTIASAPPPNGTVGAVYSADTENCTQQPGFLLGAGGGWAFEGEYTFSSSSLPPGLQIGLFLQNGIGPDCRPGPAVWILYGTPTQAATFNNVVISVKDSEPLTASTTYTITIGTTAAKAAADGDLESGQHHHYKIIDMGTFGGPQSRIDYAVPLNNQGTVSGSADTPNTNPYYGNDNPAFFPDPYIEHTFQWKNGVLTDLGSLPSGGTSLPNCMNKWGDVAGNASNSVIDPIGGWPESRALLYQDGQVLDLGTMDDGSESAATCINDRGVVVGFAGDTTLDPYSLSGWGTQTHAFRWTKSQGMQDLGTLGGPDAIPFNVNDAGQISGFSYTDSTPNPTTGLPTVDPFLWENDTVTDLGGLGGTASDLLTEGGDMNAFGQVVGNSDLAGDVYYHPFLWTNPGPMRDLGTLGGNFGSATSIDDAGEVVGWATNAGDENAFAFLWKNNALTNLGTVDGDPCSIAWFVGKGRVVGASWDCGPNYLHAFLWENGAIVDLNRLVTRGSSARLFMADHMNERGEITAGGVLPNGDKRAFLLIPCDENHPGVEGCDYGLVDAATELVQPSLRERSPSMRLTLPRRSNRFHVPAAVSQKN